MCGLVGMIGNVVENDKKMLRNLLIFDQTRGWDSTGLAVVVDKGNEIQVAKTTGGPDFLFLDGMFDDKGLYRGPKTKVFIGHNRAATKGKITDDNAHPFHHGAIVGAHNGTLRSQGKLVDFNKFDVDSEAIIFNLDKKGWDEVIPMIHGAYALTWYDGYDDKMMFVRNSERDLYYTRRKDKDVIFWASEEWMLQVAAAKSGVPIGEIELFKENIVYSFDVSNLNYSTMRTRSLVEEKKVEGYTYKAPPVTQVRTNDNKGSNVVPLHSASSSKSNPFSASRNKEEVKSMESLAGTEIEFKFGLVKTAFSALEYISAFPADMSKDYDIRIYGMGHPNAQMWMDSKFNTVYTGRVKKFIKNNYNGKKEYYLLIDLRTIVPAPIQKDVKQSVIGPRPFDTTVIKGKEGSSVDEDTIPFDNSNLNDEPPLDDDGGIMYKGFDGEWLTELEWHNATAHNCAWCSHQAEIEEADKIQFFSKDEFLCEECKVGPAKDYLVQ